MWWIWVIVAVVVIIALYLFLIFPSLNKKDRLFDRSGHFAHRGLFGGDLPENSAAAFLAAVENRYAMEMDVHVTTDNIAVVSHDDCLKRMFNDERWIEKSTYEEIKDCTLPNGEKLMLFSDFLKLIDGRVPLMIELKTTKTDRRVAYVAADILKDYKGEYCMESFNPIVVKNFKKAIKPYGRKVLCGQLAGRAYAKEDTFGDKVSKFLAENLLLNFFSRPDFVSYQFEQRNNLSFKICKALGSYISYWTIRKPEDLEIIKKEKNIGIFQEFKA